MIEKDGKREKEDRNREVEGKDVELGIRKYSTPSSSLRSL